MTNLEEEKNIGPDSQRTDDDVSCDDASKGLAGRWRKYVLQGLLLTMAASFLVVTFTIDDSWWEHLDEFPLNRALAIGGMVAVAWLCNGLRTVILSRALAYPLRFIQALGITLSMEFAIAATPGGVGGVASRLAFQRRAGLPLHVSMTMIAADLSADLLFFAALMPFAILSLLKLTAIHRLVTSIPWELLIVIGVVLLGTVTSIVLLLRQKNWMALVARHPRLERFRLAARWKAFTMRTKAESGRIWRTSVHLAMKRPLHYFTALLVAAVQWTCRYGVLAVILATFGVKMDFLALILMQGMLFFFGLLIIAPGGGGSLEILSTLILKPLAGAQIAGLSVIFWRFFTYYLYVAAGGLAFLFLSTRRQSFWDRKPATEELAEQPSGG